MRSPSSDAPRPPVNAHNDLVDTNAPQPASSVGGLAAATLILGILGMIACLPLGLAAIILGAVLLRRGRFHPQARETRGMIKLGIACGIASLFTGVYYVSVVQSFFESNRRLRCAANLHALGVAVLIYSNDYPAQGPPHAARLAELGLISADSAKCPSAGLGSESYSLVLDQESPDPGQRIVAYESRPFHGRYGGNVLFGDGRVEYLRDESYRRIVQRFGVEIRPKTGGAP